MRGVQVLFDGDGDSGLPPYQPPCRERRVPGLGSMWVYGYTAADAAQWLSLARQWSNTDPGQEPSARFTDMAQMCWCCRTGPDTEERTFVIRLGGLQQAAEQLSQRLPGKFARTVCLESDALAWADYLPPEEMPSPTREEARERLGQRLADPHFWLHLNWLSVHIYGVALVENRRPIGEILAVLQHDQVQQNKLLEALGSLAALAGGLG